MARAEPTAAHAGDAKHAQRQAARRARASVPSAVRASAEARIAATAHPLVLAVRGGDEALIVAGYAATEQEVSIDGLLEALIRDGASVCLPRVVAEREVALHLVADLGGDLVPGAFGIREPRADLPTVEPGALDAVLVPGVAFDRAGGRLGQGGGFYDRLLPAARQALSVGVCLEAQLVPRVVTEPHDVAVDAVVTEVALYR